MRFSYGQYCPIAKAVEVLGDRWTLLIVRDLLTGTSRFNDLERGLPGISRGLLASRLRWLQQMGILEKREQINGRRSTEYRLTRAGMDLQPVINALLVWGVAWAFEDPAPTDLDPVLLMWWMRNNVRSDQLPEQRVVAQFDFRGAAVATYWLLLTRADTSLCLTHPGFEIDVLVTADLSVYFEIWLGRRRLEEALHVGQVAIDAIPSLANSFPNWFSYSLAAPAVRTAQGR
jgi:DNA-binding HxlR family transcriptional regulator